MNPSKTSVPGCVTWSKCLTLSDPHYLHLQIGDSNSSHRVVLKMEKKCVTSAWHIISSPYPARKGSGNKNPSVTLETEDRSCSVALGKPGDVPNLSRPLPGCRSPSSCWQATPGQFPACRQTPHGCLTPQCQGLVLCCHPKEREVDTTSDAGGSEAET